MPHDLEALNATYTDAPEALSAILGDGIGGDIALVSSFGADAAVLLHMASQVKPDVPVLFLDTELLFPETLAYQRSLAARLGLTQVHVIRADELSLRRTAPGKDTDACCAARKTWPLNAALATFDGWISGRKRFQTPDRANMQMFETDDAGRLKINPLAHWQSADLAGYMDAYGLPRHPLVAQGFKSIGCAPCTDPVGADEDARAGRWAGENKTECGIHLGANSSNQKGAA